MNIDGNSRTSVFFENHRSFHIKDYWRLLDETYLRVIVVRVLAIGLLILILVIVALVRLILLVVVCRWIWKNQRGTVEFERGQSRLYSDTHSLRERSFSDITLLVSRTSTYCSSSRRVGVLDSHTVGWRKKVDSLGVLLLMNRIGELCFLTRAFNCDFERSIP